MDQTSQSHAQPADQQRAATQQGGTATLNRPDVEIQPFSLTHEDATQLQTYRREAENVAQADNATAVLLIGRAGWNARQVQDTFGISQDSTFNACQAWRAGQGSGRMDAIRNLGRVDYYRPGRAN